MAWTQLLETGKRNREQIAQLRRVRPKDCPVCAHTPLNTHPDTGERACPLGHWREFA